MSRPEGGLPRNFIEPAILLLIAEGQSHGYDLIERLNALGLPKSDPGGVYRTLRRLQRENRVDSWWVTSDVGPPRRAYHLTPEGLDWLHAWAGALRESRRIVSGFLKRYEGIKSPDMSEKPAIRPTDPVP
ncbi:MAG: helix-turn-helix transcriptional regulator [Actinomycetota bacterium]